MFAGDGTGQILSQVLEPWLHMVLSCPTEFRDESVRDHVSLQCLTYTHYLNSQDKASPGQAELPSTIPRAIQCQARAAAEDEALHVLVSGDLCVTIAHSLKMASRPFHCHSSSALDKSILQQFLKLEMT